MPISSTIVPELGLALRTYSGTVTMADLRAAVRACLDHPHYTAGMAEIDDLLAVDHVDIGFDEMMAFAKDAQSYNLSRGFATTHCFLVNNDPGENSVSMYHIFLTLAGESKAIHVLPGYPETLAVLDLPNESIDLLPEHCRGEAGLL